MTSCSEVRTRGEHGGEQEGVRFGCEGELNHYILIEPRATGRNNGEAPATAKIVSNSPFGVFAEALGTLFDRAWAFYFRPPPPFCSCPARTAVRTCL